mmetsp:Transcript_11463/g.14434  ORF Transcript_11463/g.14434 Transcript_11463/m.14434 type:complete len:84 (+) Transcript_11463:279-530(+)
MNHFIISQQGTNNYCVLCNAVTNVLQKNDDSFQRSYAVQSSQLPSLGINSQSMIIYTNKHIQVPSILHFLHVTLLNKRIETLT